MYTWQRCIPVLLEDVDAQAQYTTGQVNGSLQRDGRPSYAVQLQQLGSNNHSTPQVICLPQKPPAIDYIYNEDQIAILYSKNSLY